MCNLITYAFPFVKARVLRTVSVREQVILHACVATGNGDISPYCPSFYHGTDSDFVVTRNTAHEKIGEGRGTSSHHSLNSRFWVRRRSNSTP